jgi:APA family basic amino acid/polyamine antiporter
MAYAMARREDLPSKLSRLHARYNSPHYAIWITGILMELLVLLNDLSIVVALGTFTLLFYYASANVSALHLPKERRVFHQIIPILGAASCVLLLGIILFTSPQTWIIGIAALTVGAVYYFVKARIRAKNPVST